MPEITVDVVAKVATTQGAPVIVCGNSDYEVKFNFDTEWAGYKTKTARFVYTSAGVTRFKDVIFEDLRCPVPVLSGVQEVYIGVYAGSLHTTTPARVYCKHSILCGLPQREEPTPDVYNQLMDLLASLQNGGAGDAALDGNGAAGGGGVVGYIPDSKWSIVQEDNSDAKTSATLTAIVTAPCLLVAMCMFRSSSDAWTAPTIEGDGWQVLNASNNHAPADDTVTQHIYVWYKTADSGVHDVTVTQTPEARLSLKVAALYDAASLQQTYTTTPETFPATPADKQGKRRLYLLASYYALTDGTPAFSVSDAAGLDLLAAETDRFCVYYDRQPDVDAVPTFGHYSDDYQGTAALMTIDITEEGLS